MMTCSARHMHMVMKESGANNKELEDARQYH